MLLFVTECFRVLQSVTEYYRVFLAHLLGPISGLVLSAKEANIGENKLKSVVGISTEY